MSLPVASLAEVRQLLDSAGQRHAGGVLAVRAQLTWAGDRELTHDGKAVRVVLCESALAVRAAVREARDDDLPWLVVITDRDEHDLGLGLRAHLVDQRLRNPDPWGAVRDQFAATRIDRRLVTDGRARDLAAGLLAARGDRPWTPARGGLLGYDHAMGSVASRWFEMADDPVSEDVLRWSTRRGQAERVDVARAAANDTVVDAVLTWLASRCGRASRLVEVLVKAGRLADLVPLGVAARAVLECPDGAVPWTRLEARWLDDRVRPDRVGLGALVDASEYVLVELLHDSGGGPGGADDGARQVGHLLTRADEIVAELRAEAGAPGSTLLRSGLTARLASLGEALGRCVDRADTRAAGADGVDGALADLDSLTEVEAALAIVQAHGLARGDHRVSRALAGVRLARWLAAPAGAPAGPGLAALVHRHRDVDAWVDWAYGDVWRGVDEETLARGLAAVAAATRQRRARHDDEVGEAVVRATATPETLPDDVVLLEDLVARTVVPLARDGHPVLLVVADGMSVAVGAEVVDDVELRYDSWVECLPAGRDRRQAAVAVLPSLTEVSRCSLLSGTLTTGGQTAERRGFDDLMRTHGLTGTLLHRMSLDSSGAGNELAPDVRVAIDDTAGMTVVACVLNSIDDALDRMDPGIDWTAEAVTHLRPLLEQARRAGRVVVLTADHGHVIDRREGRQVPPGEISSNRSRAWRIRPELGPGEVRVRGTRVLEHDGDAVLAVDEDLRYGPKKAGYHGGTAPAEIVVPVHVLTPGAPPTGYELAVPQAPAWWRAPLRSTPERPLVVPVRTTLPPTDGVPTLFDEIASGETAAPTADLAARVVTSEAYVQQRSRALRVTLDDAQVLALLRLLLGSADHRADPSSAAAALGVSRLQLPGALPMAQRLLNVEQYAVLDRDADGQTVVLDVDLLCEQFGVDRA